MNNEKQCFIKKEEIVCEMSSSQNLSFTPLKDSYSISHERSFVDLSKKSALKKRKIMWDDIVFASELILKRCRMLEKISGPYVLIAHKIIGEIFANNQITMEQVLGKHDWLQKDRYINIIDIIRNLQELLKGVDNRGMIFTATTISDFNEEEKRLIVRKTALLVIGKYLSENRVVHIKAENFLQIEETLRKIICLNTYHTLTPPWVKVVVFQDSTPCKPTVTI